MTDSDSTSTEDESASGVNYQQVTFVVLAVFALILTAFVAPPSVDAGSGSSSGANSGPGPSDFSFDWRGLLEWLDWGGNGQTANQCSIHLVGDPIPGTRSVVVVWYEGRPLSDAPVWFNGQRIGRTNRTGRVVGDVPYTKTLRVRVGLPSDRDCTFVNEKVGSVALASTGREGLGGIEFENQANADETRSNTTAKYEVEGTVEIDIKGKPYPEETVTIEARIESAPMRQATVEVDGERVGRTDDNGRVTIRVPDDGSERFEVRVSRGDFAGTTTVDVLLLDATLHPEGLVLVPGTIAVVHARLGDQPVEDAVVTVDGERRGTTGANGVFTVELPLDPTATVTVSTDDQTASASIVAMYRIVAPLFVLIVAAITAIVYRVRGVHSACAVIVAVGVGLVVMIADTVLGLDGLLVASVAVAAIVATVAALVKRKGAVGTTATDGLLERTIEWVATAALRIVRTLERTIDWARALVERVRWWLLARPRSLSELLDRFETWIRSLPERALRVLRRTPIEISTVVASVAVLAVGYAVAGSRGLLVAVAALILAWATRRYLAHARDESGEAETTDIDPDHTASESTRTDEAAEQLSIRELWRAFARRIDPSRWRTQTPSETARDAIDQDYPDESVRELTTLFCEVEYGGRSRSETVRKRAEDAYETIEADPTNAEGEGS